VIVIAGRPQQAVHAGGGDGLQPPFGLFYILQILLLYLYKSRYICSIDSRVLAVVL